MTSDSSRYAYFGFPPTPNRESPRTRRTPPASGTATSNSRSSSSSYDTAGTMSPSPIGKQPQQSQQQSSNNPKTPTKITRRPGQTPQRSGKAPPKLGQTPQKGGQAVKNEPSTPKATSTQQPESDEPQTPDTSKAGNVGNKVQKSAQQGKVPAKGEVGRAGKKLEQAPDDDQEDDESQDDDDEPLNKVELADNDPGDELQQADPDPIQDDNDDEGKADENEGKDAVEGADDQARQTSDDTKRRVEPVEDDVDDEDADPTEKVGQLSESTDKATGQQPKQQQQQQQQQQKQQQSRGGGGLLNGAKSLAGKASGLAGKANGSANKAGSTAGKATQDPKGATRDAGKNVKDTAEDVGETAQEGVSDAKDTAEDAADEAGDVADDAKQTAQQGVEGAKDTADGVKEEVDDQGEDAVDGAKAQGEDAVDGIKDQGEDAVDGVKDQAEDTADGVKDQAEDAADNIQDQAEDTADDAKDQAEDAADDAKDQAEDAADDAKDQGEDATDEKTNGVPIPDNLPLDLSVLKGLEVEEDGTIYDQDHNPIGRLAEGDAEDLAGYPIGDDGEILDEDGDLVGRVELLPDEVKRQLQSIREEGGELPEGANEYLDQADEAEEDVEDEIDGAADNLPGLDILEGLTCGVDGLVYDADGNTIGQVTDGDPEQLQHATLNDQGEFVDDDGNVVGHAELHEEVEQLVEQGIYQPQETANGVAEEGEDAAEDAADAAEDAVPEDIEDQLPGIEALQGRELNEAGEVLDDQGNLLAGIEDEELKQKIADGEIDPNTLTIDEQGQVVDADGNVLSKTELVEGAAERLAGLLDFRILDGKKINKKGKILDDDGEIIGELTDGELTDCAGQKANDRGEVHNKQGELVGHVRVVPGEAAQTATRELLEELGESGEEQGNEEDGGDATEDLSFLEGYKVNKKGQVLDEDGEPIAELSSGDPKACAGKKINATGDILDSSGEVIGSVRPLSSPSAPGPDLSSLEGFKVNKKGQVLNEDGEQIAELASGDPQQCAGKKINAEGKVLDASGEVIGSVQLVGGAEDAAQDGAEEGAEEGAQGDAADETADAEEEPSLPPLSVLEGLQVNKAGNLFDASGRLVGELTEGNARKLSKGGNTCDDQGQFWDNRGRVIGRAQTVPQDEEDSDDEDSDDEAPFAGWEGLRVVEDGWVQDSAGETVGYVVEGDAKKLKGREVDRDGEILDKKGRVVGKAERYIPDEEGDKEEEEENLEFLKGKTVSKAGLVMGDEGVPVARLVEGKAKELAGKKLDERGQLWNDSGKVVGRVELIPEEEREQKPEGPFAGLEDLRVVQGGKVADEDGNVVGEIVEGNARRLVGLSVDEDGDIVDKYGNVKGRAEPLPDEEDADYSILDGLTVNKQGNVVDSNGVPYGRLVQGNAAELAGRQCDENGLIYNDTGKVIGRCEPLPEEERVAKPEGPFAGLEGLRVAKGGKVVDEDGNEVGEITEGDPKRLVGLHVDEDGDIIDKFGNTKGHAEPLVEEEQEETDNSILNNKTVNKQGYVVDEKGIPFGRLVEGNISELAGRKCDENGYIYGDTGKVVGRCEVLPENERVARPEGPFAGLEGLRVVKDGFVEDSDGNRVGQISEGDAKRLVGLHVDEDGDIIDKYGNVKGHAEPWSEEEEAEADLSALAGTVINKAGYAVDGNGAVVGRVVEGNAADMVGKKVDGSGQIWDNAGNVIGRCELAHGAGSPEGPFAGFEGLQIQKDGSVTTAAGDIVGRIIEGDIKKLLGHTVDEDGDVTDKNGNTIGKAERWEPEEKERRANPMSGRRVNKEGEVRDDSGDLMGRLTSGDLGHCVGQEIDDSGNVVDVDGNKIGEVTLIENIAEDEFEGPSEEELAEAAKREEEREIAEKMGRICTQTLERVQPICKQISDAMEKADRTPREELDEEALVDQVKPLIEEGGRILQECNGSLRGLDPDGRIAAQAKGRAGTGEATPEEYRLAETLKELTTTVVTTIDNAKKKLNDMPHAKKKLNPLWGLLTQPLFQILAAVGLLLAGVLGLVGQLLNALGLGGLVNGLLGGLGINKLLSSLGLGGGDDKKKKKKGGSPLGNIPVVGGLLGGK